MIRSHRRLPIWTSRGRIWDVDDKLFCLLVVAYCSCSCLFSVVIAVVIPVAVMDIMILAYYYGREREV